MKTEDIVAMRTKLEKAIKLQGEIDRLVGGRGFLDNAKTVLIQSNYNGCVHTVHYTTSIIHLTKI